MGGGGPAGGDGAQRQLHVQKHPGALALRNQVGARPPLHRQEGVHHLLVQPVELLLGPRPASVPRPVPTSPPHGNHTGRGGPQTPFRWSNRGCWPLRSKASLQGSEDKSTGAMGWFQ